MSVAILNGPGEETGHGRDVGGEGVTYEDLMCKGRPRIRDHIWRSFGRLNTIT